MSELSPYTGLGRAEWARFADCLVTAVRPFASPHHAQVLVPGREGGYGRAVDGLEGFARTFLPAGFRLAGDGGADPHDLAGWYAEGIRAGVDPASPERWVRLDEHPQAKVEAASIALVLDLTRPWIWDRLDTAVQQQVVDYLAPAVGDPTYPPINWVWFRLVVQTFLRSVGGPWSLDDMLADLATHDGFARADGWLSDGSERSFDHYAGWALHLYPALWARMEGAAELAGPRRARDVARLDRFLVDALTLVGGNGSPLLQGRSLTYRFAAAAPFWAGALAEVPSVPPGALRRAASGILRHFCDHGVPDPRGLLTLGWHGPWPRLAQAYSGPGSPYWAGKGLLGLALPADHPAWTAVEEPLPIERGDTVAAVPAPGWLVCGTRADGIVRVINHGTDHADEGALTGDSPLYARLGYSTVTSPLLDDDSWVNPLDRSVCLLDRDGRASHRTGMRLLGVCTERTAAGRLGIGASVAAAHWLTPRAGQLGHGGGYAGHATPAGRLLVLTVARGPWEVLAVRYATTVADEGGALADEGGVAVGVRVGGWPVSGPTVSMTRGRGSCTVVAGTLTSTLVALSPATGVGADRRADAAPLGARSAVPWLTFPAEPGRWLTAILELSAHPTPGLNASTVAISRAGPQESVAVTWPDGRRTRSLIPWRTTGQVEAPSLRLSSGSAWSCTP